MDGRDVRDDSVEGQEVCKGLRGTCCVGKTAWGKIGCSDIGASECV